MSIEQKVVIITGASQGMGAGLVRAYRDRNYRVIASSRAWYMACVRISISWFW